MSAAGSGKRPADNCSRKQPIRFRKTHGGRTGRRYKAEIRTAFGIRHRHSSIQNRICEMIFPAPTPRLVLRAWREEDLGTFTAMNADPRVMEYFPAPLTPEQSAEFMERIREEFSTEGFGLYAVERREDGELLGYTGLHRVTFTGMKDKIEIGWRLRAECWNQGYATEAAQACVALAAKLGIEELVAFTTVTNLRSQRVMQKLGMELLCEFDHPALPEGHPLRRHVLYLIGTEK